MDRFITPDDPKTGDLVWHIDGASILGPDYIVAVRDTGYGSNKRKLYVLFDTTNNAYHYCERKWLKVPMEIR